MLKTTPNNVFGELRRSREKRQPIKMRSQLAPIVDRASPMYDCMWMYYQEQRESLGTRLREQKKRIHKSFATTDLDIRYQTCIAVLRSSGSRYVPSEDPAGVQLSAEESVGRGPIAREAQRVWKLRHQAQKDSESFDRCLEGASLLEKKSLEKRMQEIDHARRLHCARMAAQEARRWAAAKWRKVYILLCKCVLRWRRWKSRMLSSKTD